MKTIKLLLLLTGFGAVGYAGVSVVRAHTPGDTPLSTVRAFLDACHRHDAPGAMQMLTPEARAELHKIGNIDVTGKAGSSEMFTLSHARIHNDLATVAVHFENSDGSRDTIYCLLRQEQARWGIFGMRIPLPMNESITLNFEHPGDAFGSAMGTALDYVGKAFTQIGSEMQQAGSRLKAGP